MDVALKLSFVCFSLFLVLVRCDILSRHQSTQEREAALLEAGSFGRNILQAYSLVDKIEYSKLPRPKSESSRNSKLPKFPNKCTGPFKRESMTGTVLFSYKSTSPFFCCFVCSAMTACKASMFEIDSKRCVLYSKATPYSCTDCRNLCTLF